MKFTEWIACPGRKIIVTDRIKNGNRLIRKYNREKNADVLGASCMTLQQIAQELLFALRAFSGEEGAAEIAEPDTGVYILEELLREKKYSFIPEESLCIRTSEVVMQSLNQIRMNDVTACYTDSEAFKITDIKDMIVAFEDRLRRRQLLDYPLLLQEVLARLEEAEEIGLYLPWLRNCRIGILEDVELTSLEDKFLNRLMVLAGTKPQRLTYFTEKEEASAVKYHFFKAYGIVNEIRYVIEKIVEKSIPYGEVNLFYTSPIYENFIRSAFESRGIPYQFLTGENVSGSNIVRFMLAVLDWAEEDFLYERLHVVVENPLITFAGIQPSKQEQEEALGSTALLKPLTCYNRFLRKGIGWSRKRYKECIQRVRQNEEENEKYQYFLTFLEELTDVFDGESDCGSLYEKLLEVTLKYTSGKSPERKYIKPLLDSQKAVFAQAVTDAPIPMIRERLRKLSGKKESDNGKVSILRIQNLEVLERSYHFVIGLSAKQFVADTTESPVLSDEELQKYLSGKVLLAAEAGSRMRENLRRTFETLEKGNIVLGYSVFDTIELKESAPSVFYSDYWERFGCGSRMDSCGYEIAGSGVKVTALLPESIIPGEDAVQEEDAVEGEDPAQEEDAVQGEDSAQEEDAVQGEDPVQGEDAVEGEDPAQEEDVLQKEEQPEVAWPMSSSALQTLLECPLRYYYHYVHKLPGREFLEKQEHRWLSPADKGNLFHHTMEQYCKRMLMSGDAYTEECFTPRPDEAVFREIYEKVVEELLQEVPYTSYTVFLEEKEEERENIWQYLQDFQAELYQEHRNGTGWRVLGCELDFADVKYRVKNPDGSGKDLEVCFSGSIDRVDGYVDEENILNLRIVDYKTGSMKKKKSEVDENRQIQHLVYAMAALDYEENHPEEIKQILALETDASETDAVQIEAVTISSAQYVFPHEKKEDRILDVSKQVEDALLDEGYRLPHQVNTVLWNTMGELLCGEEASAQTYMTEYVKKKEEEEKDGVLPGCKYCSYIRQCRRKLGKEL